MNFRYSVYLESGLFSNKSMYPYTQPVHMTFVNTLKLLIDTYIVLKITDSPLLKPVHVRY